MREKSIRLQSRVFVSETHERWVNVPAEILGLILSRLYFRDRSNFKLACKSWNLIRPIPRQLPPPPDSPEFDSPCLMIPQRSGSYWKVFHSLYNDFYCLDFPELVDTEILSSRDGWLLMSKDKRNLFFFNPLTKAKVELPLTPWSIFSACFTCPPTSSDCIVFGIFTKRSNWMHYGFTKVRDSDWKSWWGFVESKFSGFCAPVFVNGLCYYLDCKFRNIAAFHSAGISAWIPIRREITSVDENKYKINHECYMLKVEGGIWGVFVTNDERQVSVEKLVLDFSARPFKNYWVKINDLGNKCLYVSPAGSFADTCTVGGMANKIYFNKFHGRSGVVYSLTSGMYHSVNGEFASKEGYGLTEVDYGVWIKPTLDQA